MRIKPLTAYYSRKLFRTYYPTKNTDRRLDENSVIASTTT